MANELILRNGFRSLGSGSLDGKLTVNNSLTVTGNITSSVFIKVGASGDDILLGDGTTTSLASLSPSSVAGLVSGSSQIDHDQTTNFVANEHIDWTTDQGATNIHSGNYTDTNTTYNQLAVTTTGGAFLRLNGSDASNDDVKLASGGTVTVSFTDANTITITGADQYVGTVTSVTAGNGMTQSGTDTINPTLNIVSHAGSAGTIGTINIGADAIGVNLGSTSTTAAPGNHTHATLYEAIASGAHTLVSGSSQITYSGISSIPAGIVSGAAQVTPLLPTGTISGSSQVNADTITNFDSNVLAYINSQAVISGSGYLKNTTDTLTGNLTVTGIITAQEFHTEFISSSIIYESGSTKFGDTGDDQHQFTGSVLISGSLGITNNALVTNLNSDLLDSQHGSYYLSYTNFTNLPTLVSGSSQVSYTGLSSIPAGIVSGAAQVTPLLPTGTVSGSSQVSYIGLSSIPAGIVSGSSQVTLSGTTGYSTLATTYEAKASTSHTLISGSSQVVYTGLTSIPAGIISGSSQLNSTTISGLTISTSATIGGATPQTSVNLAQQANAAVTTGGLRDIATITTTNKIGAHVDYGVVNGTNSRVGTVMIVWNGATQPVFSDNSTADMGDTSGVVFSVVYVNASTVKLQATTTTSTWDIRTFVRTI